MKILIVEDETTINDLIKTAILMNDKKHSVTQTYNGDEAIHYLDTDSFDLMITDIIMPEIDGLEILKYLELENIQIPIVILSSLDSEHDQLEGFSFNIEDYWTKPLSLQILAKKLDRLIQRIDVTDNMSDLIVDDNKKDVLIYNKPIGLSHLEFKLFRYLYTNKNIVCSKYDIIARTWEDDEDISERNVDFTIKRIRKKLGEFSITIKTKVKAGYYYEDPN